MHRAPLRLALAGTRLLGLTLLIAYAWAVAWIYPYWPARRQSLFRRHWAQCVLRWLHVRPIASSAWPDPGEAGALLLANHISWLDVLVIQAHCPAHFVAKSEVGRWPLLGWLVRRSGTLLLQRERRSDARRVGQQIGSLLRQGQAVALFPQGTSTPATEPVLFHAALLQCAIDVQAPVHPVVVYYQDAQGQRLAQADFVGDTGFITSLWRIVCTPCVDVSLTCLPALDNSHQSRRHMAQEAQQRVNAVLTRLVRLRGAMDCCHANAIELT